MRDPNCTRCVLHKTAKTVCLLGQDPKPSKVMIVGEAPGEQEDASGTPFVGKSGQLLRDTLAEFGVEGFITNAVSCRPPNNRTPKAKEIEACRYWLQKQVDVVKPKFVMLLGNVALESMLLMKGITKVHGVPIEREGVTYFPVYHPSFILRDPSQLAIFKSDIKRFKDLIRGVSDVVGLNPVFVDNDKTYQEMKDDLMGDVSFDIETTGLYPWKGQITAVGFGTRRAQYVIPWNHEHSPWRHKLQWLAEDLDEAIADCDLITQNGKFDALWMKVKHGVGWFPKFDTMLGHYLLDENAPHDLEYLAANYFGAPPYDVPLDVKQGKYGFKPLTPYLAHDLYYTRKLKYAIGRQLDKEPGIKRVFEHIMMPCVRLFTEIEFDGVFIDTSKFDEAEKYLRGEINAALTALKKWEPPPTLKKKEMVDFNWGSPQQVGKLLFEDLKIPIVEKTAGGANSVSESVLKRIDHPLVTSLLKHRGAKQQLSFFIEGWKPFLVGEYLHPSFKLHGAVTGRLSGEHPNLQQVPRDPRIRQLISAPDGWVLIEADLSQIEMRVAAELSGDQQMNYAFTHGIDVHWLTLMRELARSMAKSEIIIETAKKLSGKKLNYYDAIDELLKRGPDAATEINPEWKELRKKAKAINFGYLFGMWWKKFIIYARDNYDVIVSPKAAQESRESFFELYADLPAWHKRQQRFARNNGYVVSLSGRKRHLPEAMSHHDTPARAEAMRQAVNSPVQSFANEINLMSALQLRAEYPRNIVRTCGTVHDSILARVKRPHVVEVSKRLLEIMRRPPLFDVFDIHLKVPVEADLKIGAWSRGKNLEKWS